MAGEETTNQGEQGNIKAEYNVATTGLNMDNTVNQVPKGMLTYALNAAVENFDANSVNYQNEPGNEFCLEFPSGYQLIGTHFINEKNKHIFFLANDDTGGSQIGYMDNNDCIYHTLIDAPCLNFNIDHPIHKVVHKTTNCSVEIYWTDGFNPRRYLDINNVPYFLKSGSKLCDPVYTNEVDCNQLKLQPNFQIPELSVTDIQSGGSLTAGTYQFAIQYADASGNAYTSYYSVTNPTPIANTHLTTPNFNYEVGRSIILNVTNLDGTGQFQYFNIAVIKTINAISSVELVGTYFIDKTEKEITYTGQNVEQIRLTINDIFEKYPYYDIAQDVTTAQDVLVWDNLASIDRINYQQIASQISLQWQTYRLPADENYSDALNATNLRGYLRDEVYAFEIVFLLRNGKQTDGFHIPGRVKNNNENFPDVPNTSYDFIGEPDYEVGGIGYSPYWKIYNTASVIGNATGENIGNATPYQYGDFAYWESTETYPCNVDLWGDLANQPIRHHKFPDVLVSPIFENPVYSVSGPLSPVMQNDAVFPIGVKVDIAQIQNLILTSSLTREQKDDIVGFKIVRGDRGTNKSIIAKGILRNVGKYTREETEYYYPNYPYNDIKEDPFILNRSNAYQTECSTYRITPLVDGNITFVSCETNQSITQAYTVADGIFEICSIDIPVPDNSVDAIVYLATYKVYQTCQRGIRGGRWNYISPQRTSATDNGFRSVWINDFNCMDLESTVVPVQERGGNNTTITVIAEYTATLSCDPNTDYLKGFESEASKYRHVFNSPETSFGQPFLGGVLKLENVIFGAGHAHFVQVKDHAMYKLLTKEAQRDALDSSRGIGDITVPFNGAAMFAAYQAYLAIYINGITRRNYAYSFNSIASYDYSADIQNNLGIKQRQVDLAQYLIPGVQSVGDDLTVNNWYRESSVYIKTSNETKDFTIPYTTYDICNTSIVPLNDVIFTITDPDPAIGQVTVRIYGGNCTTVNSTTYPLYVRGALTYTIGISGTGFQNVSITKTPFDYPNQTPSLIYAGNSIISDNSRFTISDKLNCNNPGKIENISVVSYYGSLKNIFVNQWGQIYSYTTVDTGFQRVINPIIGSTQGVVFGGDTFISRFAFKTKLPFFIDNRVNAPDDSDIFYDEIGNIAYPKYWFSGRSVLDDYFIPDVTPGRLLSNIISYKAHYFDCPNSQNLASGNFNRTFYDGKMYLFAYGIPNFYCESSVNTDLRQAFNNKEGDFWPHVSTSIPDDWVQETNVTIAQDNTYYYNVTFSKQNKENYFNHLPPDWTSQLCYTYYPFRAIYSDSQSSSPDNKVNAWLTYAPLSYYDFPQNYGALTSLDGIQNRAILARFENKSLLYNSLLVMNTSNPQAAYLGSTKLFGDTPPIDFAETDLGYVGSQNKFLLKIPQGQITVDAKRGQVFLISGGQAADLSQFGSGLNRFFTDHLAFEILRHFPNVDIDNHFNGVGLHGVYDSKFDRVIISKLDYIPQPGKVIKYNPDTKDFYTERIVNGVAIQTIVYLTDVEYFCNKSWTLSFNMNTKSWISFHSYIPNFYIAENNFFYSGLNGSCDLELLAISEVPCTTTTSTTNSHQKPITTTSTTTLYVDCTLEGTGELFPTNTTTTTSTTTVFIDCTLEGTAVVQSSSIFL